MKSSNEISITHKIFILVDDIDQKNNESSKGQLIILINQLINSDFTSLIQLLYRIDVDERKLKEYLKLHEGSDSASVIADLIIKRHLQKNVTRKQTSSNNKSPSEDSW